MKKVFDFYLTSSIHVSLAVVALVYAAYFFLGIEPDAGLLCFVFLATVSGYNFIKYAGVAKWYHRSLPHKMRLIQIFSLICFIGLGYCIWLLPSDTRWLVLILAAITFLYVVPIWPKSITLRSISGLKIFIIGMVWSATALLLPIWHEKLQLTSDNYIYGAQIFLIVIGLTIPFEIKDLDRDNEQLRTLPQWLGVRQSKIVAVLCFALAFGLDFFKDDLPLSSTLYWLFVSVMGIIAVLKINRKSSVYITSFWIESIPIWAALGLLLFA